MNAIGSPTDALILASSLALVGVFFTNEQEVHLFIWGWIRSFTLLVRDFVNATITTLFRTWHSALDFAAQIFQIFVPFTSKTLTLFQRMWGSVLRNETVPIRRALELLETLRTAALSPIATGLPLLLRGVTRLGSVFLTPLRDLVSKVLMHVFQQRGIDITMSGQIETRIADQARKATQGYKPVVDAENTSEAWWRQIVTADGILQPRTVLETTAALSGSLVGMFANGGLQQDRDADIKALNTEFALLNVGELIEDVTSGAILTDSAVLTATAQLEKLLTGAKPGPAGK